MIKHSKEEHAQALANYLPDDETFEAKNIQESNLRQLLRGLAKQMGRVEESLILVNDEYFPDLGDLYIPEWERVLKIPDDCFKGNGTLAERRRDILVKMAAAGIQTDDDFVKLAEKFGVTVKVTSGRDEITFPLTFPVPMFTTVAESRYTIVVKFDAPDTSRFPLTFPILFGTDEIGIIECLFNHLKPENCDVMFVQE